MDGPVHLTDEQELILNLAKKGHNVCMLGRAGVGKSPTVQEIKKTLSAQGKKCKTVCSTGIACQNYAENLYLSHVPLNALLILATLVLAKSNLDVCIIVPFTLLMHKLPYVYLPLITHH